MSLSPRLLAIAAVSAVLGLIAAGVAYPFLADEAEHSESRRLLEEVTARADARHEMFDKLISKHRSAIDRFRRRFQTLEQAEADALFEAYFPEHHSGARRSRPEDFDGIVRENGQHTFGMGAFIGEAEPDARTRRVMVAAFQTVRDTGPAYLNSFKTLHFTDARNLVVFAPEREDRLMFYREEAPADFRLDRYEMVEIVQPANNPLGRTACTGLVGLVYTDSVRGQSIGCHTPVRIGGAHLGAFGDTLDVAGLLREAVADSSDKQTTLIITRTGDVVSHPALFGAEVITDADVQRISEELGLAELGRVVAAHGQRAGVIKTPATGALAAYARMDAPGWFMVLESRARSTALATGLKAGLVGAVLAVILFLQLGLLWQAYTPNAPARAREAA